MAGGERSTRSKPSEQAPSARLDQGVYLFGCGVSLKYGLNSLCPLGNFCLITWGSVIEGMITHFIARWWIEINQILDRPERPSLPEVGPSGFGGTPRRQSTFRPRTGTPSRTSRGACLAAISKARVPSARITRHQGIPVSRRSARTTARAAPGFPARSATWE